MAGINNGGHAIRNIFLLLKYLIYSTELSVRQLPSKQKSINNNLKKQNDPKGYFADCAFQVEFRLFAV